MPEIAASKDARRKFTRRSSPAGGVAAASSVDRLLGACGVVIACSSLGFAGYMLADKDRPPRIAGMEYLSIFARPSHPFAAAEPDEAPVVAEAANERPAQSIDPTPTGSILDHGGAGRSINLIATPMRDLDPKSPTSSYRILDVSRGEALIGNQTGFRRVKAGDVLPDLGRVNALERRGDHWVLLTQRGAPLEWPGKAAAAAPTTAKKSAGPP